MIDLYCWYACYFCQVLLHIAKFQIFFITEIENGNILLILYFTASLILSFYECIHVHYINGGWYRVIINLRLFTYFSQPKTEPITDLSNCTYS